MNNKAYDDFMAQDFKGLSNWIYSLNPYEFTLISTLIGFIICPSLSINQQNSLGNFFEQIGQTMLTISSQSQTVKHKKKQVSTMPDDKIDDLEKEIHRIKEELYQLRRDALMNDNI